MMVEFIEAFSVTGCPKFLMLKLSTPTAAKLLCLLAFLFCCTSTQAQNMSFNYYYKFEPAMFTDPPEMGGLDVTFPDAARKNGVEGTAKVSFTLGEDGKVRDVVVLKDLSFGVGDAIRAGVQKLSFKPATFNGKPTPMKVTLDYIITMAYAESDKNVTKPKITAKPNPVYPQKYAAEKTKGTVSVTILFFASGELKVVGVSSTMPKEFDKAAVEAAKGIQFTPAIHKKSKQPVSQEMLVEFNFKP